MAERKEKYPKNFLVPRSDPHGVIFKIKIPRTKNAFKCFVA